jgi:hypothetical protein
MFIWSDYKINPEALTNLGGLALSFRMRDMFPLFFSMCTTKPAKYAMYTGVKH